MKIKKLSKGKTDKAIKQTNDINSLEVLPINILRPEVKKVEEYKVGQHLLELMSSPDKENIAGQQISLFGTLPDKIQSQLKREGITEDILNKTGKTLVLNSEERRLIDCLLQRGSSLAKRSVDEGQWVQVEMYFSDLCKLYSGEKNLSGSERKKLLDIIFKLAENKDKKALINYQAKKYINGKEEVVTRIRYENIIRYEFEKTTSKRGSPIQIVIGLNPVFTDQLLTYYAPFPKDTVQIMTEHWPKKIPVYAYTFRDYIAKQRGHKQTRTEMNAKTAFSRYFPASFAKNDIGRCKHYMEQIIQQSIKLGHIEKYESATNNEGELKYIFFLTSKNQDIES